MPRTIYRTPANTDDTISGEEIQAAIDDLLPWKVGEDEESRIGEVAEFATEDEAIEYIQDLVKAGEYAFPLSIYPDEGEQSEREMFVALKNEVEDYSEWPYVTLIRDSHFADYAREYYEDLKPRGVDFNVPPFDSIDWDAVADGLQDDYTDVDFDGVTYWFN